MDIISLLSKRVTCRNWASTPVESEKKQKILETISLCPVKSGRIQWKLLILDETKSKYKKHLYDYNVKRTFIGNNVKGHNGIVSNPQILSPYTLIWLADYDTMETLEYYRIQLDNGVNKKILEPEFVRDMYIGIAGQAFAAMISAQSLGLDTGFVGCFSKKKISFISDKYESILGLGIGYGIESKRKFNNIAYEPITHPKVNEYIIDNV